MEAGLQPRHEPGLGMGEVDAGDADLGKSALVRPSPQSLSQAIGLHERIDGGGLAVSSRPQGDAAAAAGVPRAGGVAAVFDAHGTMMSASAAPASPSNAPDHAAATWHWPDEAACAACAAALARRAALRDATIELHGPLGAGKTTFVRHLLRALGVSGRIKSPTYTVVETYRASGAADRAAGELAISHFDFYRFTDPRELLDAGLRELFAAPGLKLVEWPARAAGWLPPADLRLTLEPEADDSRRVQVQALSARGRELLA
jgi:tRNA threonylcarbamoyladenosine biosynthesis protein TsaE